MTSSRGDFNRVLETSRAVIACGIDPEKCIFYRQGSLGGYHTQLMWLLSCLCPFGWLGRMVQYKEKRQANPEMNSAALFTYPILQAADILLFHGTVVPVGEDQQQHLELVRFLAQTFNNKYETNFFPVPVAAIQPVTSRIMSLRDASKKMSKSSEVVSSVIYVDDLPDVIHEKVKRATTDSERGISFDPQKRPEVSNLVKIFAGIEGCSVTKVVERYASSDKVKRSQSII